MILILTLSMVIYVVNGFTSLTSNLDILMQQKAVILSTNVAYFPEFSIVSLGSQITLVNQIASSIAYILTWMGTVKLLYPYIQKLGKIKFWSIMSTAMVYYLVYFPFFVFGYFTPSDNVDAMTNILIFSLSGIFTGVVFGAAFLSVARTLNKNTIKGKLCCKAQEQQQMRLLSTRTSVNDVDKYKTMSKEVEKYMNNDS